MFETIMKFFKKIRKNEAKQPNSKEQAKERLHLVLMQDRANVSADFLEMMKQEIIDVIKKYIEVEENAIDVRLTNEIKEDGTTGAPSLYANIPILNIRNEMKKEVEKKEEEAKKQEEKDLRKDENTSENQEEKNLENGLEKEENEQNDLKDKNEVKEEKEKIENSNIKPNQNNSEEIKEDNKQEETKPENENEENN